MHTCWLHSLPPPNPFRSLPQLLQRGWLTLHMLTFGKGQRALIRANKLATGGTVLCPPPLSGNAGSQRVGSKEGQSPNHSVNTAPDTLSHPHPNSLPLLSSPRTVVPLGIADPQGQDPGAFRMWRGPQVGTVAIQVRAILIPQGISLTSSPGNQPFSRFGPDNFANIPTVQRSLPGQLRATPLLP